ncbi:MAG: hypothetical protein NZM04_02610 [Methylacidiphilales bacterium]|nr:hypothetical protein [Candidatus Methylacidiphilales bacterium]
MPGIITIKEDIPLVTDTLDMIRAMISNTSSTTLQFVPINLAMIKDEPMINILFLDPENEKHIDGCDVKINYRQVIDAIFEKVFEDAITQPEDESEWSNLAEKISFCVKEGLLPDMIRKAYYIPPMQHLLTPSGIPIAFMIENIK